MSDTLSLDSVIDELSATIRLKSPSVKPTSLHNVLYTKDSLVVSAKYSLSVIVL